MYLSLCLEESHHHILFSLLVSHIICIVHIKEKNIFLKMRRRVEKAKKSEAKAKGILEKAKRIFEKSYLTIYTRGHVIVHTDIHCISLWTITAQRLIPL